MTTTAPDSVLASNSGTEVSIGQSADAVEMGSGEPGSVRSHEVRSQAVNGEVSVALVQEASSPKAEIQTAERVKLDEDKGGKCCCMQ